MRAKTARAARDETRSSSFSLAVLSGLEKTEMKTTTNIKKVRNNKIASPVDISKLNFGAGFSSTTAKFLFSSTTGGGGVYGLIFTLKKRTLRLSMFSKGITRNELGTSL